MKRIRLTAFIVMLAVIAGACAAAPAGPGKKVPARPAQGDEKSQAQWWGKAPGQQPAARGIVENVGPANIAVKTPQGVKQFAVNDKTRVLVQGKKATIADVKVGMPVGVKLQPVENNVPLALAIIVPKPGCGGEIVSVANNVIVVRDKKQNTECQIVVSDKTKYRSRGYQGTFADLRVGYRAMANGRMDGGKLIADAVEFVPTVAKGTVVAVNGNLITLKAVRQQTIPAQVGSGTVIIVSPRVAPDRKGTLADIKVGTPANMGFHINPNAPASLLWIDLLTGS